MTKSELVSVGDVIRSKKFAYGKYNYSIIKNRDGISRLVLNKKLIEVDGETKTSLMGYVREHKRSGEPVWDESDIGSYNLARGKASFVVETARSQGGGIGHGPNDVYPDGWYVEARRLTEDGKYDSEGEVIRFYQTGCFNCMVENPEIVGKMKMSFAREKLK
jgi:hypothetical protein